MFSPPYQWQCTSAEKLNIYHNKIDYLHEVSIAYYINVFTSHGEVLLKPIFCVLA